MVDLHWCWETRLRAAVMSTILEYQLKDPYIRDQYITTSVVKEAPERALRAMSRPQRDGLQGIAHRGTPATQDHCWTTSYAFFEEQGLLPRDSMEALMVYR